MTLEEIVRQSWRQSDAKTLTVPFRDHRDQFWDVDAYCIHCCEYDETREDAWDDDGEFISDFMCVSFGCWNQPSSRQS